MYAQISLLHLHHMSESCRNKKSKNIFAIDPLSLQQGPRRTLWYCKLCRDPTHVSSSTNCVIVTSSDLQIFIDCKISED